MEKQNEEGLKPGVQNDSTDINRSAGQVKKVVPFRHLKTESQPGMPGVLTVSVPAVLRRENPRPTAVTVSSPDNVRREMGEIRRSRMSPEDQEQFYGLVALARENAITCLDTLIRYDEALTMHQAESLSQVVSMIHNAEVIQP